MERTKLYEKALQISNDYAELVDTAEMYGDKEDRAKKISQWSTVNDAFAKLFNVKLTQFIHDAVWLEKIDRDTL